MLELLITYLLISLSVLMVNLLTPHLLILTLLTQTLVVTLLAGCMKYSVWFSYVLFLIFLGGMLVLFTYVASLASGDMLETPNIYLMMFSFIALFFTFYTLSSVEFSNFYLSSESEALLNLSELTTKTYCSSSSLVYMSIALYLFYALICVAEMLKEQKGPLQGRL